ncbi:MULTISPECIES: hypothetical protein [Okeania]|uniref:Uncharacterized protein n=2 Tax=Okeania TaxID=1458928 RepID=A0A3N6RBR4_9CYAN|nr:MULTISPECIES: hypothetical protein [Okeania]NEP44133.1 hypothetical protein [Okeania sp. SIO2H7]NEP74586.1 hypothetical protein [Okeania sp. SIO2G5]NEQ93469.1 hypothetical protein [Okeania sp. SIO2G4]NET13517.1 hypothetical protein [Okeania sp. SIO1H6]NEP95647.1 hypothetical protein [Okeania sp. SIO2F5]
MELLQEQIIALSKKIEAIHTIIEKLNDQVSTFIIKQKVNKHPSTETTSNLIHVNELKQKYNGFDLELEHKDVLVDDDYMNQGSQNMDGELTSEIQIQRLTAQLTAAYNRIAALEEQLLSRRIKT